MSLAEQNFCCLANIGIGHKLNNRRERIQALVQMSREGSPDTMTIIRATYGILFFGCPNRGMNIQSLIPMCDGRANMPFLLSLRQDSDLLRQLSRDFPVAFPYLDSRIISFFETLLSPTAQQVSVPLIFTEDPKKDRDGWLTEISIALPQLTDGKWAMTGSPVVLVNETSATHCRPGENQAHNVQAINRTHSGMVKFGRRDETYILVVGFLQDFADSATAVIEARFREAKGTHSHLLSFSSS